MGNIYVGNSSGIASKVKNAYIGVDSVARKIKQVYVGDENNIARLVWRSGGNYLFCTYGNTDSSNRREVFSAFDRSNNSTFTPVTTTDKIYTSYTSSVGFSRDDASTVVYRNTSKFDFYRRSGDGYSLSFSASTVSTDFVNYVPNSGDTAFIHSATLLTIGSGLFGLSSNGRYFYVNVFGYETQSGSKNYTSAILIFDISNNDLSFKQAITITNYNTSYGSMYSCYGTASDDLSVFAFTYQTYDGYETYDHSSNVCIGAVGESYQICSLNGSVYSGDSFAIYSYRDKNIKVSPDGNYVSFCLSVYNSDHSVYYNQKNGYAKIDKANKTVSSLISLGAAYEDVYTAGVKDWGFIGNDYLYFTTTTSAYSNEGRIVLFVYKKDSNGDFQKTTKMELTIPISPSEYFYSYGDDGYYKTLSSIAFDFDNQLAIFFEARGRFDICELNGGDGAFTGYTKIGEYSFDETVNINGAYLG